MRYNEKKAMEGVRWITPAEAKVGMDFVRLSEKKCRPVFHRIEHVEIQTNGNVVLHVAQIGKEYCDMVSNRIRVKG